MFKMQLVERTPKHGHISPVLQELHWLPVEQRIIFKILLMTFKCLNGIAPSYLSDLVTRYIPKRNLRSANGHRLFDVKYNLRNYGFRSFSVASPQLWNDMPPEIRSCDSLNVFKKKTVDLSFQESVFKLVLLYFSRLYICWPFDISALYFKFLLIGCFIFSRLGGMQVLNILMNNTCDICNFLNIFVKHYWTSLEMALYK